MANPWRYRFSKDGPCESAIYNQRWTSGCYGCRYSKQVGQYKIWICQKSQKGYPNLNKFDCRFWEKRSVERKETKP